MIGKAGAIRIVFGAIVLALTSSVALASPTDARGNATGYGRDGFDRLATTTYPDTSTETLTYDADGNVLSRQTRKGDTISFAYDTLNRLCTKTISATATACGGTSSSALTSYTYDPAGHLTGANDNGSAIAGVSTTGVSYAVTTGYDALNRPTGVSWNNAPAAATPGTASVTFAHRYNQTNQRVGQTVTDNSWWTYPPGTASSVSYTANALDQYTAVGSVTPTYDGNGNLTCDGSFKLAYDSESRLTTVSSLGTVGNCSSAATTVATYAYDAQGRRKSKTAGGATTIYVTDADNREVLEYDGTSGAIDAWYAHGVGGVANRMNVAAGTRRTFIPDIQGSTLATLDSSSGALTKTAYLPYGENTGLSSGSFLYTGRRFDGETAGSTYEPSGLYYYRARMYSPTLGRFLQPDPIGYRGGKNLYAYVGNDPLNATDPRGLAAEAMGDTASNALVSAFGNPSNWPSNFGAAGAGAGAIVGGISGGIGGGTGGAAGGTLVFPGVGTIAGGVAGAAAGATYGAAQGAVIGGAVGYDIGLAGQILMNQSDDSVGGSDNVNAGNLKQASMNDLKGAAQQDGYNSVESWKQQELGLSSRDQIYKDNQGNLYSVPRQGGGTPQSLNIKVP